METQLVQTCPFCHLIRCDRTWSCYQFRFRNCPQREKQTNSQTSLSLLRQQFWWFKRPFVRSQIPAPTPGAQCLNSTLWHWHKVLRRERRFDWPLQPVFVMGENLFKAQDSLTTKAIWLGCLVKASRLSRQRKNPLKLQNITRECSLVAVLRWQSDEVLTAASGEVKWSEGHWPLAYDLSLILTFGQTEKTANTKVWAVCVVAASALNIPRGLMLPFPKITKC